MATTEQPELSTEARLALRRYTEQQHGDLTDIPRLAQTMFNAGYRNSVADMVRFQGLSERIGRVERDAQEVRLILERIAENES